MEDKDIMRKNISASSLEESKKIREEMQGVYNENMTYEDIENNPILRPISEINNSFINLELLINRALWEYEENKKQIDKMIEINPKYSETMILSVFQNIIGHIKQIIHAQDLQKENMKEVIDKMIKISNKEYALIKKEDDYKEVKENIVKVPKETNKVEEKTVENNIPQKEEIEKEEEPKSFHSELLEKEIPINLNKQGEQKT